MEENQSYSIKKQLIFDVIFDVNSLSVKLEPLSVKSRPLSVKSRLSDDIHILY
jgi:hypothetical protein